MQHCRVNWEQEKLLFIGEASALPKWYEDKVSATEDGGLPDFSPCGPIHPNLPHSVEWLDNEYNYLEKVWEEATAT